MHGVSEWTRERQQERADEHPGEGEAGLEREKPRDASAHARQSLAICSLLEVVVLAVLLGVSLQQLSLSPLLYVGAGLALGALGALCSCCGVAGQLMLLHVMLSFLAFGLLVDPVIFAIEECTTDCVTCGPDHICPYCCLESNGEPCECPYLRLACFAVAFGLQLVGVRSALVLTYYESSDSSTDYRRFDDDGQTSTTAARTASSTTSEALGGTSDGESRRRLQEEARFAANRVFRS